MLCATDTSDHGPLRWKTLQAKQHDLFRSTRGQAVLYILLKRFGATVRATIGLHSRFKFFSTTFTCLVMTFRKGKRLRPLECTILYTKGFCLTRFGPQTSDFLGKPRVVFGDLKQYSLSAVMRETAAVIVLGFQLIFVPASGHESDSKCICKSP